MNPQTNSQQANTQHSTFKVEKLDARFPLRKKPKEFERRQKEAVRRENALNKNRCPDCGDRLRHQPSENGGTLLFCNAPSCSFEALDSDLGVVETGHELKLVHHASRIITGSTTVCLLFFWSLALATGMLMIWLLTQSLL